MFCSMFNSSNQSLFNLNPIQAKANMLIIDIMLKVIYCLDKTPKQNIIMRNIVNKNEKHNNVILFITNSFRFFSNVSKSFHSTIMLYFIDVNVIVTFKKLYEVSYDSYISDPFCS